jgi:hypothetical protein
MRKSRAQVQPGRHRPHPDGSGPKGPRFGPRKTVPALPARAGESRRPRQAPLVPFWRVRRLRRAGDGCATRRRRRPPHGRCGPGEWRGNLSGRVWNLGRAPAFNARVEFYWFNPSLGFNEGASNLIGATYVDLGHRSSGKAVTMVKCPTSWVPTYLNNGHECLMVRAFEPLTDLLTANSWNAADDRHLGQRNISVVNASSPAVLDLNLRLGCAEPPGDARSVRLRRRRRGWRSGRGQAAGYRRPATPTRVAGVPDPRAARRSERRSWALPQRPNSPPGSFAGDATSKDVFHMVVGRQPGCRVFGSFNAGAAWSVATVSRGVRRRLEEGTAAAPKHSSPLGGKYPDGPSSSIPRDLRFQ